MLEEIGAMQDGGARRDPGLRVRGMMKHWLERDEVWVGLMEAWELGVGSARREESLEPTSMRKRKESTIIGPRTHGSVDS